MKRVITYEQILSISKIFVKNEANAILKRFTQIKKIETPKNHGSVKLQQLSANSVCVEAILLMKFCCTKSAKKAIQL